VNAPHDAEVEHARSPEVVEVAAASEEERHVLLAAR
jgi:hypothetical protein